MVCLSDTPSCFRLSYRKGARITFLFTFSVLCRIATQISLGCDCIDYICGGKYATLLRTRRKSRNMVAQQTFTEQQIGDFQEAFSLFDNKGDGKIFAGQLGEVLRALGQNPTEAEVRKYQQQYKSDQRISFDVFLPILHEFSRSKEPYSYDSFIEGLRHFDTEGNGLIKTSELRHLLTTLGDKLSEDEFKDLITGHEDSNGNINYEDFIKNLMSA
ncbi:myosin-2 essential light chain-like [Paramacrobiotus metropolitanus]|uniref:myosin-2 essential light chain-like n=1 Tax=Paramacrobiotus metropolitanus TaxID=2943436 RepID=UPI002445F7C5|nr:myosin-2 essential light chain-like [Paramacrobiotus metropolitanus]